MEYLDAGGSLHRQAAQVACVASNSIETPRLLRMSASAAPSDGLARHYLEILSLGLAVRDDQWPPRNRR